MAILRAGLPANPRLFEPVDNPLAEAVMFKVVIYVHIILGRAVAILPMKFQKQNSALLFTGNSIYVIDDLGHNEIPQVGEIGQLLPEPGVEVEVSRQHDCYDFKLAQIAG